MEELSLQEQYLNNVPNINNKYTDEVKVCHTLKLSHEMSKNLHIKKSDVHGKGLFAKDDIKKDCMIQATHVKNKKYGVINLVPNSDYNHSIAHHFHWYMDSMLTYYSIVLGGYVSFLLSAIL